MLQQYLPFTVLKQEKYDTCLTYKFIQLQQYLPFTVLKHPDTFKKQSGDSDALQQYLPFTVLKLLVCQELHHLVYALQQYLPFTVLKLVKPFSSFMIIFGCNSTYRLRY